MTDRLLLLAWIAVTGCSAKTSAESTTDAADPRCQTQPVMIGVHTHAAAQPTADGQGLIDTRG